MIILDAETKKLRLRLAAAGTIPYTTSWSDITTTTFVPGAADGYSAGAAAVDIVAAPGASTERKVQHISVYNSSGADALDEAAVSAAWNTRWVPAQNNGQSVGVWTTMQYVFQLTQ